MNPNQQKRAAVAAMQGDNAARAAAVAWRARRASHHSKIHGDFGTDFGVDSIWVKIKAFFGFKPKAAAALAAPLMSVQSMSPASQTYATGNVNQSLYATTPGAPLTYGAQPAPYLPNAMQAAPVPANVAHLPLISEALPSGMAPDVPSRAPSGQYVPSQTIVQEATMLMATNAAGTPEWLRGQLLLTVPPPPIQVAAGYR